MLVWELPDKDPRLRATGLRRSYTYAGDLGGRLTTPRHCSHPGAGRRGAGVAPYTKQTGDGETAKNPRRQLEIPRREV